MPVLPVETPEGRHATGAVVVDTVRGEEAATVAPPEAAAAGIVSGTVNVRPIIVVAVDS